MKFKKGDWVMFNQDKSTFISEASKGTKVKIVGETRRGYDVEDENGTQFLEVNPDFLDVLEN